MELIIVVIIIGVLAAVAIPSYRIQTLKMKNQEAVRILMTVWEAQKEYYRENGVYTTDINSLSIDIPMPKNFEFPQLNDTTTMICAGPAQLYLARMGTNSADYKLFVLEDGRIVCQYMGNCTVPICAKMGFKADW